VELPADDVLVEALRSRDEAAFALMVDAWSSGMLRLARSYVSTADSAAEVVQETWLAVIAGIGRFECRSALRTWVYRILVNTAKRRGLRESRTIPLSSIGPTVDPSRFQGTDEPFPGHWREFPAAWPASPEESALAREVRTQVSAALALLPDRQRAVITLRDLEGYSSDEVCEILNVSAGNQRVLLHRARAFVRGKLEVYYSTIEVVIP
jgi:RNA polymerase sigma-70 factor, ECF subfamily